ncbi:hypothetical protein CALVIDRAFT_541217 [Calocera viscosa TUFC12733]|uniref:THO complex subunit 2 n=1 Tax=Calocera viscosa (strain TUFC12733) TaxID=1330018 RepID=A0A167I177_CALVF|nr:hypothetical protein CALVIDRAFT_541217 [Calocera viscosa TUFC12733]
MDIESITRDALKHWSDETERGKLLSGLTYHLTDLSHSSPVAACICTLLEALVPASGDPAPLSPPQLAAFLDEVKQSFPSSSSEDEATLTPEKSEYAELILDLVWTIDATLEDQLGEITAAIRAEWQAAKDAARADAMDLDVKEGNPAPGKDDKPPEKSSDPETEKIRLASEAQKRALAELVRELVTGKHVIKHALAVERLEQPLLIAAGLVRSGALFEKKTRQTRTNLFYKQTKFNLLREESEGYSKLIVELLSHHDQPASFTWQRVVSLIGFFDLDPHRVLDLIFDVMESTITMRWRWFLDLLREAGWARRRTPGKGKEKESVESPEEWIAPSRFEGQTLEEILRECETCDPLEISVDEKVMDVPAQLLGFKFSNHVHNQPNTPTAPRKELYLMVAILVREGVVSLPALYPHLYPTEDDMKSLEERHQKALKEQAMVKRTNNALTRAAPLSEEPDRPGGYRPRTTAANGTTTAATSVPTGPRKAEPPNHKMGLLRALLSVGALRPALWILTKHPWMFGPYSALADLYLRLLECSLEPLYSRISLTSQFPEEAHALSSPLSRSSPSATPKTVLTDLAPEPPQTANTTFEFFYDHWKDWIPTCRTSGDIQTLFEPLLRFIGVHAHRNVTLLTKLGRLGKEILESEGLDSSGKEFWRYMLSTYLLPALSFQRADQSFSSELWSFLRHYRITDRWQMYAQWREVYTTSQEMRNKHTEINRAVKDILRRVSALPNQDRTDRKLYDDAVSRVKQTARDFCKFAHTNPCIAFAVLVDQIEGYGRDDNGHFVEMLKLLGPMSYDVFLYQIVNELASIADRTTVKEDGVTPADWLQGLAGFIGHLGYGVRPDSFEFKALFKVLANNLKSNELHNLVVLEEFIVKMSGIESFSNLSDAQVLAISGGKNLRIEGVSTSVFGVLAPKPLAFQKSSQRFLDMLQSTEFALPLLILLAQQRQVSCFVAAEKDAPKKLADLFDNCQRVLFQYIFFFSTDMTPGAYAAFIPSLKDLCVKFHIEPSIAWHMLRPKLSTAVTIRTQADAAMEKEAQLREKAKAQAIAAKAETSPPPKSVTTQPGSDSTSNGDLMNIDVKTETPAPPVVDVQIQPAPPAASGEEQSKEIVHVNGHLPLNGGSTDDIIDKPTLSVWHPELEPLFDEVTSVLPDNVAQKLGPAFYVTFWQLSLYDIYNLSQRYSQEITRMKRLDGEYKSQIKQYGELKDWVKKEYDSVKRYNDMHPHDRPKELPMIPADSPIQTDRQLIIVEKSIPKFSQMSRSLLQESKDQTSWIGLTRRRLQKEKDHWFGHITTQEERNQALSMMLQHCVMPRALISPMDASFCAKFVKHMHSIGTKNFMTLRLYDRIFSEQLTSIIFSCTEMEMRNYARMLSEMLIDLHAWFNDKDKYTQEAQGLEKGPDKGPLPGFLKRWPAAGADQVKQSDLLSHEEFQRLIRKFHNVLTNTFVKCLESQEYMHARNAVLLMVKLLPVFPVHPISSLRPHPPFGATIEERLASYIAVETRHELKLAATGYLDMLRQRKKEWMPPAPPAPPIIETAKASTNAGTATAVPRGPRQPEPSRPSAGAQVNGTAIAPSVKTLPQPSVKPTAPPIAPKASAVPAGTPTGPSAQTRASGAGNAAVSSASKPANISVTVPTSSAPAPAATRSALEAIPKPEIIRRTGRDHSSQPPTTAGSVASDTAAGVPITQPNGILRQTAVAAGTKPLTSTVPVGPSNPTLTRERAGPQPTSAAPASRPRTPVPNGGAKEAAKPAADNRTAPPAAAPSGPSQPARQPEPASAPSSQSIRRADAEAGGSRPLPEVNATARPAEHGPRPSAAATVPGASSVAPPAGPPQDNITNGPPPVVAPRDLPPRPVPDTRQPAGSRPISPPRNAPNNPRGPPGRRRSSRSRSPEPRRGARVEPPDDTRDIRARIDRDARDRYPRGPEAGRDHLAPREFPGRPPRGDSYRPGDVYPEERRDARYPDRPDGRDRDVDRPPRERERIQNRDRDRDRDEQERGRDRGREREERDRDRRADTRPEPVPPRTELQPKAPEDEAARRGPADDTKSRKRTHDQDDVPEARESKRHRRGRGDRGRDRDDRTPSDKDARRVDRDRDRDRRRDDPRRDDDKAPAGSANAPITPSSAAPPSGPRAMNRSGPPSPPPPAVPSRRETASERPPPQRADSSYPAGALPTRPPPENMPRDDRGPRDQRPRTPPRDADRAGGATLADRLGPRREGEGGGDNQDIERSGGRKRGYSERDGDMRDENGESRDPNKRQRRIDRSGAREREQNKTSRMFNIAMGDAQKQDGGRSGRGRRGGGDAQ